MLVCVVPNNEFGPLHSVKWHPKDPDTLAVASDSNIYLLDVREAAAGTGAMTITQADLPRFSHVFSMTSVGRALFYDATFYHLS